MKRRYCDWFFNLFRSDEAYESAVAIKLRPWKGSVNAHRLATHIVLIERSGAGCKLQ